MSVNAVIDKGPADAACIERQTNGPIYGIGYGRPAKEGTPIECKPFYE
jgi:hypothetical protein